ncbi:RICIN domain-containing protein [Streptomyces sp. H10-C2]|uniref:RICIN domain-containing protein n=1 Tax=unclassified Streptomyces TaxID=2593676 RepID=UPI0024BA1513|nr:MULTISPECIES: RICIN domain-containing protein [unclassified Streptomyces]MDJ0347261.1 RICIN domain-containing protein [Streptomyces sp. PH10-H1]MDJ0375497.1 RICIN domain-containing protein [Streptomyces sp. H10-C2]
MNLLQLNDRGVHRRRSAGKRRTVIAVALASATLVVGGVTALASTGGIGGIGGANAQQVKAGTPQALDSVPRDEPRKGLVYEGLKAAPQHSACVGGFEVEGVKQCTHGPDSPPKGLDITKVTPPAVKAAPVASIPKAGGGKAPGGGAELLSDVPVTLDVTRPGKAVASAPPASTGSTAKGGAVQDAQPGPSAVVCDGDGSTGNRVQVVYVHGPGSNRFAEYLPSYKKWAHDSDVIYNASAAETGGVRHIRYVTESDCTVAVLNLEVPAGALQDFSATNQALATQGLNRRDRKYMIFADANVYCGIGSFAGDERPGPENTSNFGPSYGRTDSGCWGGSTPAHELGHNLGAVNNSAPHSSGGGHCVDEWDLMCYSDTPYHPQMQIRCPDRASDDRLDCNHDDYFNTSPQPGSYLTTHWNVADNQFLLSNGGTNPNPNPNPNPTPTPTPTPTTGPTPTPTPTPTTGPTPNPTTGPDVAVSQLTQNSAVLSWKPANAATGYDLLLDQKNIGTVKATTVRVVSLRPGTQYKVAVAVHGGNGKVSAPGRQVAFRTQPSTGTAGPVEPGKRYLMLNSFTGQAADVFGASRANGAVLIGYQRHGYTNQQWLFEDAGSGYVRVKSVVSGKCLQIGGQPVAGQWVAQQPCSSAAAQAWKITANATGYTLGVKGSSLVLGVSNRDYYGGALLELQQPGNQAWQRWTFQQSTS